MRGGSLRGWESARKKPRWGSKKGQQKKTKNKDGGDDGVKTVSIE